jgi:hypothetical protein
MTLSPARTGNTRKHPFLDVDAHGFYARRTNVGIYVSELLFLLLSVLAYYPPGTVIPYSTIATVMWPGDVSNPYDGSFNKVIRTHLDRLLDLMVDRGWDRRVFEVKYSVGIRVNARYLPRTTDNLSKI